MLDSWNDLATDDTDTPEFLNCSKAEGGRDFVDEPPINSKLFFTYTAHAVGIDPIPH
jgi:hypothetical protein